MEGLCKVLCYASRLERFCWTWSLFCSTIRKGTEQPIPDCNAVCEQTLSEGATGQFCVLVFLLMILMGCRLCWAFLMTAMVWFVQDIIRDDDIKELEGMNPLPLLTIDVDGGRISSVFLDGRNSLSLCGVKQQISPAVNFRTSYLYAALFSEINLTIVASSASLTTFCRAGCSHRCKDGIVGAKLIPDNSISFKQD